MGDKGPPKMSFGKDNPEGPPPLGPPFHSRSQKPSTTKTDDDESGSQFSPSFEPLLVDSPYYVRERGGRPFSVGSEDVGPLPGTPGTGNGGMIVGPDHPGFWRPERQPSNPTAPTFLPPGAVPPRARFDPITPLAPGSGSHGPDQVWPSGEPDPDMEPMSGPQIDPVQPGWRPPRGGPPPPGPSSGGGKVGGAPFFF